MNAEKDLTKGPLWKQIILFSLPLMFSNILQALFNMSDIAVVGKFAGNTALGAVGSTTILVSLFTGFLIGLGNGVNVVVARFIGEKNHKKITESVLTALVTCSTIGIILLFIGLFCSRFFLELINTKDDLIDGATLYLKIYFFTFSPFQLKQSISFDVISFAAASV